MRRCCVCTLINRSKTTQLWYVLRVNLMGYEHGDCLLDFAHELQRVKPNKIVHIHGPRSADNMAGGEGEAAEFVVSDGRNAE